MKDFRDSRFTLPENGKQKSDRLRPEANNRKIMWFLACGAIVFWLIAEAAESSSFDNFCFRVGHSAIYFLFSVVAIAVIVFAGNFLSSLLKRQ